MTPFFLQKLFLEVFDVADLFNHADSEFGAHIGKLDTHIIVVVGLPAPHYGRLHLERRITHGYPYPNRGAGRNVGACVETETSTADIPQALFIAYAAFNKAVLNGNVRRMPDIPPH